MNDIILTAEAQSRQECEMRLTHFLLQRDQHARTVRGLRGPDRRPHTSNPPDTDLSIARSPILP